MEIIHNICIMNFHYDKKEQIKMKMYIYSFSYKTTHPKWVKIGSGISNTYTDTWSRLKFYTYM